MWLKRSSCFAARTVLCQFCKIVHRHRHSSSLTRSVHGLTALLFPPPHSTPSLFYPLIGRIPCNPQRGVQTVYQQTRPSCIFTAEVCVPSSATQKTAAGVRPTLQRVSFRVFHACLACSTVGPFSWLTLFWLIPFVFKGGLGS